MKRVKDLNKYAYFNYSTYLDEKGKETKKPPVNNPYKVGDIVFEKSLNTIGVVLGCISPDQVRTDQDGMRSICNIRPATYKDVLNGAHITSDLLNEFYWSN